MQCPDTNRLIRYLLVKLAPVILGVKPGRAASPDRLPADGRETA